ncbi:MAG: hypothetical protein M3P18_23705, partial [Actinomycetota bacterium]|nr:hypothetical protein [Actinomycetota bacterium]
MEGFPLRIERYERRFGPLRPRNLDPAEAMDWRPLASATVCLALALAMNVSLFAPSAAAGHKTEDCSGADEGTFVAENNNSPNGRDGVTAQIRVIDPDPAVGKAIIRSVYLFGSIDDQVEFGWKWKVAGPLKSAETYDQQPTVFAVKIVGGTYTLSEGAGSSNPGWGHPNVSSTHGFRITRNPDGGAPARFEFHRDGMYAGFF